MHMVGEANSGTFTEWRMRNYFLMVFVVTNWIIRWSKGFFHSPLFSLKVRCGSSECLQAIYSVL